jgi:PAS domain S-box-containing protein
MQNDELKTSYIRILLIEDSLKDSQLIKKMLADGHHKEFKVKRAVRLSTGLKYLYEGDFDLILLDLSLPDSQGLNALTNLRSCYSDIPVIVLISSNSPVMAEDAVKAGACDYLIKDRLNADLLYRVIKYSIQLQKNRTEEMLRRALKESQRRQAEVSALLKGSRAVLEYREFNDAAREIFDVCKSIIGAAAGYIALLSHDGSENEVLFLDSGGLSCTVDDSLPMPIRGLRGEAYKTGLVVYDNEFSKSKWMKYMPDGHVTLENVLFAPLVIKKKTIGLIGIANKPGGFNGDDAHLMSAFAELAAIALHNSQMLESLENSENRFRSVVQTAKDAIIAVDRHGKITFWSNGAENIYGYSDDEAIGKPFEILIPEGYRGFYQESLNQAILAKDSTASGTTIEAISLRKDGSEIPVEYSLSSWKAKGEIFFTVILRDITQRKIEEARRITEQEMEAQKVLSMRSDRLRSLGEMAAGIAHELNQPLQGVRGLAEHLQISVDRGWKLTEEKIRERSTLIIEQADRMVHIIDHIRTFAREAGKPELRPVQVNDVVRSGIEMLYTQFRSRGIELEIELNDNLPLISVNPFSLEEVIINLLINARDAIEERIRFTPGANPPKVLLHTFLEDKGYVKIAVTDYGVGIPKDIIERVFDPFFTTKGPDKGTGLGLSISKSIVEQFGGFINIQSEPGEFTTVVIALPIQNSITTMV